MSTFGRLLNLPPLRAVKCSESRSEHIDAILPGGIASPLEASMKVVETLEYENATLWACDGEIHPDEQPRRVGRSWILSRDHNYRDKLPLTPRHQNG